MDFWLHVLFPCGFQIRHSLSRQTGKLLRCPKQRKTLPALGVIVLPCVHVFHPILGKLRIRKPHPSGTLPVTMSRQVFVHPDVLQPSSAYVCRHFFFRWFHMNKKKQCYFPCHFIGLLSSVLYFFSSLFKAHLCGL